MLTVSSVLKFLKSMADPKDRHPRKRAVAETTVIVSNCSCFQRQIRKQTEIKHLHQFFPSSMSHVPAWIGLGQSTKYSYCAPTPFFYPNRLFMQHLTFNRYQSLCRVISASGNIHELRGLSKALQIEHPCIFSIADAGIAKDRYSYSARECPHYIYRVIQTLRHIGWVDFDLVVPCQFCKLPPA